MLGGTVPVIVATIIPLPGHADVVREALLAAVAEVHGEDGCQLYALHETDDRFVMVEQWESRDKLGIHMNARSVAQLHGKLEGNVVRSPEVIILKALPAGDPVKGRLVPLANG
jgi:quinol monooxygenase YgiN